MPFVEVVYDSTITEPMLRQLGELLPSLVAEAVACPEEPAVGPAEPGDKAGVSEALPGIRYLGVWLVLADGWWTQT